ncbi:DNA-binding transcriptional MerR regulator [Bradyrhizobium sp. JR7.2]|uniref:hypothetical protein n=1 Tax=unclassified Bradyrhizobium TaxID=2631580 RepID=UPI00339A7525
MPMLTLKETAEQLGVSKRWLQYWLAENPVDAAGVPFYIPFGNRKKFEPRDIERMRNHMREIEAARLGPSVKAKAKMTGLMAHVGDYAQLVAFREAAERRKREEKAKQGPRRRVTLPGWPK